MTFNKRFCVWVPTLLGLLMAVCGGLSSGPIAARAQNKPAVKKPAAPAAFVVQGKIKAATRSPRPGSVPYKDAVIALRLAGAKALRGSGRLPGGEVLVYVWGMKNNKLMPAAYHKPGQTVTLRLLPWDRVEETYGGYNRLDFEDDEVLSLPTYWGEVTTAAPRR